MDHQAALVRYVKSRRKDGASVELIISGLVLNGWSFADAQNAVASVFRELAHKSSQTRPVIIILIVLFALLVTVLVYVLTTGKSLDTLLP
ncbi:MAG: hypothetical protein V1685_01240 [Parcubacteria group bacterium]